MNPRLVVFSSYPSAGKSTLSRFLEEQLGFSALDYDAVREQLYGKPFMELTRDQQSSIWPEINRRKFDLLTEGKDVVLDSTHRSNARRKASLDTTYGGFEIDAERYLIVLRVDREILERREILRRGDLREIEYCDVDWEEPEKQPRDYQVIEYVNNTPENMESIKTDLAKRFERRNGILIPVST